MTETTLIGLIFIFFIAVVGSIAGHLIYKNRMIFRAIQAGADPIEVRHAFRESTSAEDLLIHLNRSGYKLVKTE